MYCRQVLASCVLLGLVSSERFITAAPGTFRSSAGLKPSNTSGNGWPPESPSVTAAQGSASGLLASYVDWIEGRRPGIELATVDLDAVRHDLSRMAPGFLRSGSKPAEAERQRRLLATFALEVAAAGASKHAPAAARLVEWACPYIRSHTPINDFDSAWQLAALAVLEGGIDAVALLTHVDHARPLFPAEPRLLLARGLVDEQSTAPAEVMYQPSSAIEAARGTAVLRRQAEHVRASERAIAGFRAALKDGSLRAEASLRLGHVQLGIGRYDEALGSWAEIEQLTADRSVVYLVRLFRGLAFDRMTSGAAQRDPMRSGETRQKARAAYLQALEVSPGAHSATMSLAALTFRDGRADESSRLLTALLKDNDPRRDPWWSYYGGDWRFWYTRIERVRSLLTNAPALSGDLAIGSSGDLVIEPTGDRLIGSSSVDGAIGPSPDLTSSNDPIGPSPDVTSSDDPIGQSPNFTAADDPIARSLDRTSPDRTSPDGPIARSPDSQGVFRSGVDGITIQAYVRRGNRQVTGLTAADFELRDNGVRQEIATLSVERVPVDLTLLLDVSASVDGPMLQRLKSAVRETADLLRAEDRIRLVAVSQVLNEVFSLRPRGQPLPLDNLTAQGATSLYDGLAATMMQPSATGRRQLVVAFTDGRDSTSIIDEATAREIARLTDAVVDVVVPVWAAKPGDPARTLSHRGRGSLPDGSNVVVGQPDMADRARGLQPGAGGESVAARLTELIGPTAGQVFTLNPKDSVSGVFRRTLEEFRASYVLQYVPAGVTADGWHEVTVSVTKPGDYDIRARKGYRGK